MLLFKPEHVKPIQIGVKTQTRRTWRTPRVTVGSIQKAKLKMMKSDYFALLKIKSVRQERLIDMTNGDAFAEGYSTLEDFKTVWKKIYGSWNPDQLVWVVDFVIVNQDGTSVFEVAGKGAGGGMKVNKWFVLSFLVCFVVLFIETLGFNYSIGDHPYYVMGGRGTFGDGHDLTLLVTKPLSLFGDFTLPLFFNIFLATSIYFLLKAFPRIKYPEWAFILAPITPLASVYAQLFAIALFNIGLGFFFRNRYKLFPVFLFLTFFAHFWSGLFLAGAFMLYVLLFDHSKEARRWCLLPTMIIISFFSYSFMARGLDFLSQISGALPAGGVSGLTILDFLCLISRNGVFIVLACIGLVILYAEKYKKFLVLCAMLVAIPMIIMFMFSNSIYWNWRMAYFMPLVALTTVFMSWLHQR